MAGYSGAALDAALNEIRRTRDLQSSRLANLRSTAGILIGTAGIASGLVGSAIQNVWWLIPMGAFLLAAVCGLIVIWPTTGKHVQPEAVLKAAEGMQSVQVKANIAAGIVAEYKTHESKVNFRAGATTGGGVFFVLGILGVISIAALSGATEKRVAPTEVVLDQPIQVQIEE